MKNWRIKLKLWFLGQWYIPMLGFTRPKVISIDDTEVRIRIRLGNRTKNHLKSMYFGALAVGADTAAGLHVFYFANQQKIKFSFAFKKAEMEFVKRAESDVTFVCSEGAKIKVLVEKAIASAERLNEDVNVIAYNKKEEIVATFRMTLSIKSK
jgi:acyl-coenzyme A thioesterase PaaI-like protein